MYALNISFIFEYIEKPDMASMIAFAKQRFVEWLNQQMPGIVEDAADVCIVAGASHEKLSSR